MPSVIHHTAPPPMSTHKTLQSHNKATETAAKMEKITANETTAIDTMANETTAIETTAIETTAIENHGN
jgi:hypothetical protein